MTAIEAAQLIARVDRLEPSHGPLFGKMNVHQMICHCADFFRLAAGTKKAEDHGVITISELKELSRQGKTVPTPRGFGQVEGEGTTPVEFSQDKAILKAAISAFEILPADADFPLHPIFGKMEYAQWSKLAIYHLNHHLNQFGV